MVEVQDLSAPTSGGILKYNLQVGRPAAVDKAMSTELASPNPPRRHAVIALCEKLRMAGFGCGNGYIATALNEEHCLKCRHIRMPAVWS